MLPLMLGRLLHEERQRRIESDLERRRLLAPVEPEDEAATPEQTKSAVVRARPIGLAQDPGGDAVCGAS